jgi:hypothetical protein
MSIKQELISALQRLPEDASEEDVLEQLYVVLKIERGLAAAKAGKKVPVSEVRDRIKNWPS